MATLGQAVGVVVGGVIGWFIGGPMGSAYLGMALGAAIGGMAGYLIDPMEIPPPGKPATSEFQFTTTREAVVIPDILGTTKCTGNLLHYWGNRSVEITQEVDSGGKGGGKGGSSEQVVGYKYYLSWQMGICLGPVDAIFAIFKDQDCIWTGLRARTTQDMESISIPDYGVVNFYFGTQTQMPNAGVGDTIDDATLNIPYRNLCYAHFNDFYVGEVNRCPTMYFCLCKAPSFAFNTNHQIQTLEYNPVHAIYYLLQARLGLPSSFIDETSFSSVADALVAENFGIGLFMGTSHDTLGWIQNILKTINGIMYYGVDGKLHIKLLRQESLTGVPTFDETSMLEPLDFERGSWSETYNQIRLIYPHRDGEQETGGYREAPYDQPANPPAPTLLVNGSSSPTIDWDSGSFSFSASNPSMYPGGTYFAGEDDYSDIHKDYNVVLRVSIPSTNRNWAFSQACGLSSRNMTEAGTCVISETLSASVSRWEWESGIQADSPLALFGYVYEEHGDSGPMEVGASGETAYAWIEVTDPFYGVLQSTKTTVNINYTDVFDDWDGGGP